MSTNINFPIGPVVDQTGNLSLEWEQWLQNPQILTLTIGEALNVDSGGTGLTSGTSGGILGFTAAETIASSVALTHHAIVLGGGVGATPYPLGSLGTATHVLHGNSSGDPSYSAVDLTADVTGVLPVGSGGTGVQTSTGTGSVVLSDAPTLVTPILGVAAATSVNFGGSAFNAYSVSSYTATATGMTTAPTASFKYTLVGNQVTLDIAAISGTSNAVTFTITGAPAAIRPASTKSFVVRVKDNGGSLTYGLGAMDNAGTITLSLDPNGTGWTNSGVKAIAALSVGYTLA